MKEKTRTNRAYVRKKENRKELTGFRLEQPSDNMDNWISEYKVKAMLPKVSHGIAKKSKTSWRRARDKVGREVENRFASR